MESVPSSAQTQLFAAHDHLLHEAVAWLNSTKAPLRGIGDRFLVMLAARIFQLGTAVQRLCEAGHVGEAHPTARSMVSACVILSYIVEDRDGRAAAYRETDRKERKKRIADMRKEQEKAAQTGKGFFISPECDGTGNWTIADRHCAHLDGAWPEATEERGP